jgi:hypothetical protein
VTLEKLLEIDQIQKLHQRQQASEGSHSGIGKFIPRFRIDFSCFRTLLLKSLFFAGFLRIFSFNLHHLGASFCIGCFFVEKEKYPIE